MEPEFKKNNSDATQITFKLSTDERQLIEDTAGKFDLSVSEFIRIKLLTEEEDVFLLRKNLMEAEKQVKELKIKLGFYKQTERSPTDIILKLTDEERKIIDLLYFDFTDAKATLGQNITFLLFTLPCIDQFYKAYFSMKGIDPEEIYDLRSDLEMFNED